jgi:predicted DCC family thiol-disulfide oxidoreductase YuxK
MTVPVHSSATRESDGRYWLGLGALLEAVLYAAPILYVGLRPAVTQVRVLYDGDCQLCRSTRRLFESLDPTRELSWESYQEAQPPSGIPREALERRVHLVAGARVYSGFAAFKQMLRYMPASGLALAGMLALPYRKWVFSLLLVVFSAPFAPAGEAAYDWVARNRGRLRLPGPLRCRESSE